MLAETILVCWLIACVYLPFLYALTAEPSYEERTIARSVRHLAPTRWHKLAIASTRQVIS